MPDNKTRQPSAAPSPGAEPERLLDRIERRHAELLTQIDELDRRVAAALVEAIGPAETQPQTPLPVA